MFANVNGIACGPFKEKKMQGPKERVKLNYRNTASDMALKTETTFDKVAPMICHLASEDARGILGQIISIDGGLWIKLEQ